MECESRTGVVKEQDFPEQVTRELGLEGCDGGRKAFQGEGTAYAKAGSHEVFWVPGEALDLTMYTTGYDEKLLRRQVTCLSCVLG